MWIIKKMLFEGEVELALAAPPRTQRFKEKAISFCELGDLVSLDCAM